MSPGVRTGGIGLWEYHAQTRRVSVALIYVAPLVAAHMIGVRIVDPPLSNAAEWSVRSILSGLGPGLLVMQALFGAAVLTSLYIVIRERIPFLRMYVPFLLECGLWALLLGPLVAGLLKPLPLLGETGTEEALARALCSIGAGIYEEIVFRLAGVGATFVLLLRVFRASAGASVTLAVLISSAAFAVYHHIGPAGEPVEAYALSFRALAGILLGALFVLRGLGVVVYLHALYDLTFDLRALLDSGGGP